RSNLVRRGIIQQGVSASCAYCDRALETEVHLFVLCPIAREVWNSVHRWFGVVSVLPNTLISLLESFLVPLKRGKGEGIRGMACHDWALWRSRNDRIFSDKVVTLEEIVDRVKLISWKLLLAKKQNSPCLFYEWNVCPLWCGL
ncbi:hypothetical protein A2U01_0041664, partial [Trifolium medium]|nr:hypothetical protein [Trifolium medium]